MLRARPLASNSDRPPSWASGEAGAEHQQLFLPAVGLFLAGWAVFAWPWLSGRVTIPWDAKAHFLPQVQFLASSLAHGEWPFWSPNVFAGHPQIADPQSQIFSPPMLLLALVNAAPGNHAIDITVLLCLLGGGLGVMLLFRDYDWHPMGGLVAALGFAFGAAMAWRLQHFGQVISLAYLPFALLILKRALERSSAAWGLAAGAVAGLIVNGRDQVGLLEVYVLAGFAVAHLLGERERLAAALIDAVKPLGAGAVGGLAVCLVPVVLTVLLAADSNRPAIDYVGAGRGSLHPALLLTALAPHLFGAAGGYEDWWGPPSFTWQGTDLFTAQNVGECYIGAVPLIMLAAGLWRGWLWHPSIRFYSIALALSLLYALGWYTPAFRLMYELMPGVSLYRRPADAVFLIGGLGAIVAGYAVHASILEPVASRRALHGPFEVAIVAVLLALGLLIAWRFDRTGQALLVLGLAAACFIAGFAALAAADWLAPIRPLAALAIVGAVAAVDLRVNNGPNGASGLPPAFVEMLEPTTRNETIALLKRRVAEGRGDTRRDRVELTGLGFNWPNASLTHGLENTLGYNPVRLRLYTLATGAQDHSGLPDQRSFSPLYPSYRSPLANLLGLRFIATGVPVDEIDKRLKPGDLALVSRTADGYVYENTAALPRVVLATRSRAADFDRMLREGGWPEVDHASTVLLERAGPELPRRPGRVRIVDYRNTEVVVEADSPDGGWVVLHDIWHPWWRAEINGAPARIERANVIFRAVEVPAGRHRVRFVFRPFTGALEQLLGRSP